MADVTEVMSDKLTADDIVRRVDDWEERIDRLYGCLSTWLPLGWRSERSLSRVMREELMNEFGVEPRTLPILKLVSPSGERMQIEPRGLWIIGANGRLDLTGPDRHYLITDHADRYAIPDWRIAPLSRRADNSPLSEHTFKQALGL